MSRYEQGMNRATASAAKRAHIIEVATTCFFEKGYNQTGIREIAKSAGISLGNLYNHFPSKRDVLIEIAAMEEAQDDALLKALADQIDPEHTFRHFLDNYTRCCQQLDHVSLWAEIMGEAIRDPEILELFIANHKKLVDGLVALLEVGQKAGVFREQQDNAEVSAIILDSIEGYAARTVLGVSKPEGGKKNLERVFVSNGSSLTSLRDARAESSMGTSKSRQLAAIDSSPNE